VLAAVATPLAAVAAAGVRLELSVLPGGPVAMAPVQGGGMLPCAAAPPPAPRAVATTADDAGWVGSLDMGSRAHRGGAGLIPVR
jgi:hypothetical protein